jgi:putative ribosome biogenesis GTPase RsgA
MERQRNPGSMFCALHDRRASFDKLRMRSNLRGKKKNLMLSRVARMERQRNPGSMVRALHDRRASFDRLRMREDLRGKKKSLMLSLSKHAQCLSQSPFDGRTGASSMVPDCASLHPGYRFVRGNGA